jgi:hypothetical protein
MFSRFINRKYLRPLYVFLTLALLVGFMSPASQPAQAYAIPTFRIVSVDENNSVTIKTYNFPADQTFTVRMGPFGSRGIGGTEVTTVGSGEGGSFEGTYDIPDEYVGYALIAIRLESDSGYYAFNWFRNSTSATTASDSGTTTYGTGGPYYYGIPTFGIKSVSVDDSVTIVTHNFPADQTFTVRMGEFGTRGVGGYEVATVNSGDGGSFEGAYGIPDELKGRSLIAIRLESNSGYYAFNWFNNKTGGTSAYGTGGPVSDSGTSTTYYGIPTISISSVNPRTTVTIRTHNFPANTTFKVRMGEYGTRGVDGELVDEIDSGDGGSFKLMFSIPESLKGDSRVAIRFESDSGYYAYNWFTNPQ